MLSPNPRPARENPMAQKAQKDRLKANLATMDWESNANGQANVQGAGAEITIRGLAGPYTVVGNNFAPGTTAGESFLRWITPEAILCRRADPICTVADIEAAMLPIGGPMQNCQIVTKLPSVVAEMVFLDKAQADNVIATFNNKKASSLLRVRLIELTRSNRLTDVFFACT